VEDVVSEVFLVMVESITDLRAEHEAGFFAWMIQIAQGKISRAIRHLKRQATHHAPLPDSLADEERFLAEPMANDLLSDPAALQEWRETLQEVGLALGSLSAEQQVVVIGRFLAGQSIEDLARALGKQPGAVRALQFRALGALADRLGLTRSERTRSKGGRA
jgi:RNA polymerase sigma-70 factor (ECF subfamily)